jgi:hypothetical protein
MSSQVPESTNVPDEPVTDESAAAQEATHTGEETDEHGVHSYPEGVFEQADEPPLVEPGQGVFDQGHPEPGGEGVFRQGHPEREQGSGVYDQDNERPYEKP